MRVRMMLAGVVAAGLFAFPAMAEDGQYARPLTRIVTEAEGLGKSWIALKLGSIVVDRAGHATALRDMVRRAQEQFRLEDRQLVIFPEGTRKAPGAEPDYKPGVAALYRELGVTVHPMATNAGVHWPAHGFLRRPGVIVYEFLEPIPPGLKRGEFMRRLEDSIETACGRLLAEGL